MLSFIKSQFSEEQYIRHNLTPFLETVSDKKVRASTLLFKYRQQVFNQVCLNEVNTLAKRTSEKGVRVAFFKGIVLANDIYEDPSLRFFSDIDVLVKEQDLKSMLLLCQEEGYHSRELDDLNKIDEEVDRYLKGYMHHFPVISKQIQAASFSFEVIIEIHTQVYIPALHQITVSHQQVTSSVLQAAVPSSSACFSRVLVPNPVDNLLLLMLHMVKHLFYDVMESLKYTMKPRYMNFRQLLDVHLFLNKNSREIDFDILCARAVEWDVVSEFVFVTQILKIYQSNPFDDEALWTLYDSHRRYIGFFASTIDLLIRQDLEEKILLSSWELAHFIVENNQANRPFIQAYKTDKYSCKAESQFKITSDFDKAKDTVCLQYREGRYPDGPQDFCCSGNCRYDDEYIYLLFCSEDDELIVEDGALHETTGVDMLELYFVNFDAKKDRSLIRHIDVHLCVDNDEDSLCKGQPFVYVREFNKESENWERWKREAFTYTLDIGDYGYTLELGIRWEMLANCLSDNRLTLDINVDDCDNKPPFYNCRLAWASNLAYCGLHDITSYGCLEILKIDD